MNFSRSAHPHIKGSFVWRRNANTSETKRKDKTNSKKIRLTSESSDYSNLGDTQPSINVTTKPSDSKNKKSEWTEIKTMAKYSTIASRMQLKKSVAVSFLDFKENKSPKRQKTKSSFEYRVIDSQGNLTKSFKETKEFKCLNPHISKDVDRMKKRVYSMYQQQKRKMNSFLRQSQTLMNDKQSQPQNSKSIGFITNCESNNEMQKISERQEYESRINSTRVKQNKKNQQKLKQNPKKQVQGSFTKKHNRQNSQQNEPYFVKSKSKNINRSNSINKSESVFSATSNPLLKGLLGQYQNYQKLSKHQLIEKLISLEYLAQNIFKKNKFLQQEIQKKDIQLKQQNQPQVRKLYTKNIGQSKENKQNPSFTKVQPQKTQNSRNLFVINNEDGYFNEFLESEKQKQICVQIQENAEKFPQNQNEF